MTTESHLLRAVCEFPSEDTPRLVYADWCDENGKESRAAHIRIESGPKTQDWFGLRGALLMCDGPALPGLSRSGYAARIRLGFVEEIDCPAAIWLKYADAIFWHPSQQTRCEACEGSGYHWCGDRNTGRDEECSRCKTTGTHPRPFVATAQPLSRVTLTDQPNERDFGTMETMSGNHVKYYRWPGIVFELPDAPRNEFAAYIEQLRGDIIRGLGIPPHLAR